MKRSKLILISLMAVLLVGLLGSSGLMQEAPIKIGVVSPATGNYADHGMMERKGMRLAVDDFGGEVLGRPIKLVQVDSETNPDIAARRARRLAEAEGVKFMMGGVSSSVGIAVGAVAEETGTLFIATNENSDTITGKKANRHMFRVPPNMAILVRAGAQYVADNLGKDWYFVTHDYSWGWSGTRWARKVMPEVGANEVGEVKIPLGTRDFSSQLLKIRAANPDVIVVTVGGFDGVALYKQIFEFGLYDAGIKVWWTLADYPDAYALKPEERGRYGGAEIYYKATEGLQKLSNRLQEKWPISPIPVIETNSYHGWLGMTALLTAIEKAGTTDVPAVIKAMEGLTIEDNLQPDPTYIRPWDHQFLDTVFFGKDLKVKGNDITKILMSFPAKKFARTKEENPIDLTEEELG